MGFPWVNLREWKKKGVLDFFTIPDKEPHKGKNP